MEQVVVDYLKDLGISVSAEYCKKMIVSHPDYPSLLGVSDALERLGIPSQIGRIEEEHLSKVEFPFLLHLESARDGLVLIKKKEDLGKDHIDLTQKTITCINSFFIRCATAPHTSSIFLD